MVTPIRSRDSSMLILKKSNRLELPKKLNSFLLVSSLSCVAIHFLTIYNLFYNTSYNFKYFIQIDGLLAIIFLASTFFAWRSSIGLICDINKNFEYKDTSEEVKYYLKKSNNTYTLLFSNLFLIVYLYAVYLSYSLKNYISISLLSVALIVVALELIVLFRTLTLIAKRKS